MAPLSTGTFLNTTKTMMGSLQQVRYISAVHQVLFPFLTPRDVVNLLCSCQRLHTDDELITAAYRHNPIARHFGHGCQDDWCAIPPHLNPHIACNECHIYVERTLLPDNVSSGSRGDRRVSLLSLATKFQDGFRDILHRHHVARTVSINVVPFIWPTALHERYSEEELVKQLSAISTEFSDAVANGRELSTVGLHFQNIAKGETSNSSSSDRPASTCQLCVGFQTIKETYLKENEEHRRTARYAGKVGGRYYRRDFHRYSQEGLPAHLVRHGALSHLGIAPEFASDRDKIGIVVDALENYSGDSGVCPRILVPLHSFFAANSIKSVIHSIFIDSYDGVAGFDVDDVFTVEIIGGVAPSGFFTGVYLVHVWVTDDLQHELDARVHGRP